MQPLIFIREKQNLSDEDLQITVCKAVIKMQQQIPLQLTNQINEKQIDEEVRNRFLQSIFSYFFNCSIDEFIALLKNAYFKNKSSNNDKISHNMLIEQFNAQTIISYLSSLTDNENSIVPSSKIFFNKTKIGSSIIYELTMPLVYYTSGDDIYHWLAQTKLELLPEQIRPIYLTYTDRLPAKIIQLPPIQIIDKEEKNNV